MTCGLETAYYVVCPLNYNFDPQLDTEVLTKHGIVKLALDISYLLTSCCILGIESKSGNSRGTNLVTENVFISILVE